MVSDLCIPLTNNTRIRFNVINRLSDRYTRRYIRYIRYIRRSFDRETQRIRVRTRNCFEVIVDENLLNAIACICSTWLFKNEDEKCAIKHRYCRKHPRT